MNEETNKFKKMIKQCIDEIKREDNPKLQLKESLRGIVKSVLKEFTTNNNKPNPDDDKEETETISKQYNKKGNERMDQSNKKQKEEMESIVQKIDPTYEVYWDDNVQLVVKAQNMFYARICPYHENNYNVDLMLKLVDRVRAISLTWNQVKDFIKVNLTDFKNKTIADKANDMVIDNTEDREVIKDAGPRWDVIKNRGQQKNGKDAKIKDVKKDDKDYNEPQTKREEDMPNKPMKKVTEAGKDPDGKNHNIKDTPQVRPPKWKNDNTLRKGLKGVKKFTLKQVKTKEGSRNINTSSF